LYFKDSFQENSSDDDYNPNSEQAISETSPGTIYFALHLFFINMFLLLLISYSIIFHVFLNVIIGYNGYIESANIILESPKQNANVNDYCLSTYESLASSRQLLFNGSNLNKFSKYKKLKNKHYKFRY